MLINNQKGKINFKYMINYLFIHLFIVAACNKRDHIFIRLSPQILGLRKKRNMNKYFLVCGNNIDDLV